MVFSPFVDLVWLGLKYQALTVGKLLVCHKHQANGVSDLRLSIQHQVAELNLGFRAPYSPANRAVFVSFAFGCNWLHLYLLTIWRRLIRRFKIEIDFSDGQKKQQHTQSASTPQGQLLET